MPLPQPNLDDKTFTALVEEATRLIPREAPAWTDHNRHDPGITFVELFAWLAEMQHYYLNRVPEANHLKFLKLLGVQLHEAVRARSSVTFEPPPDESRDVTRGARLKVKDGLLFETQEAVRVIPAEVRKVVTATASGLREQSDANRLEGLYYGAFGEGAEVGNKLYVGLDRIYVFEWEKVGVEDGTENERLLGYLERVMKLVWVKRARDIKRRGRVVTVSSAPRLLTLTLNEAETAVSLTGTGGEHASFVVRQEGGRHRVYSSGPPLPAGQRFALAFTLRDDYPVARGSHGDERPEPIPSAFITWEYLKQDGAKGTWTPLEPLTEIDSLISALAVSRSESDPLCSDDVKELLNAVERLDTFPQLDAEARRFVLDLVADASKLYDLRPLFEPEFLRLKGDETLMLSESGRIFFNAPSNMMASTLHPVSEELYWLRATVRRAGYEVPPQVANINLNTVPTLQQETFSEVTHFGGTGRAAQSFTTDSFLAVFGENLLQVREEDGRWRDWEPVKSFADAGPSDARYVLKRDPAAARATIEFGDGMRGRVPPEGEGNIRLVSCLPEFVEARNLGRSNGLPNQAFGLDRVGVMPEGFALQVRERTNEQLNTTRETELKCLLRFRRITPTRVRAGEAFTVKVELEAMQELCQVVVTERGGGGVILPPTGYVHVQGRMGAGEQASFEYETTTGAGGTIFGIVNFTLGTNCAATSLETPASAVELSPTPASTRWRDFKRVEDFDSSGPADAHFRVDPLTGEVTFGDGEQGRIPEAPEDDEGSETSIRVIVMRTTEAERGNVAQRDTGAFDEPFMTQLPAGLGALGVRQERATGGTVRESLADAETRARAGLKTQFQAVTSDDYEYLARSTPGLRVARAKAIPLYRPGLADYPTQQSPASVTVVVVPYSPAVKPVPSSAFLRTVCRHLDRHRLVTTRVYVTAPEYVSVSVQASVSVRPGYDGTDVRDRAIIKLNAFLRPLPPDDDPVGEGWPFGRTVFKSEVYETIEGVEGVDCVEKVTLTASGVGAGRDAQGNITIQPQSLVYPGEHRIEVMFAEARCGRKQ
jgi:hypothetical protein